MKKRIIRLLSVLFLIACFCQTASAKDRFSIMNFYPNPDGGKFFHLLDSRTLYQMQFTAGTALSFSYRPLEEKNTGRKIVDKLLEQHFFATIGATDWFEATIDIPMAWMDNYYDPGPAIVPAAKWKIGIGDVRVSMKGQILDRDKYPVGLAIAPFVTIPSGNQTYFLGEDSVTGGADVVLDAQLGDRVVLALNSGVSVGETVKFRNFDRGKVVVRLGAGANIKATEELSFALEGYTSTPTNHFFSSKVNTPAEINGGVKYKIGDTGITINAGAGAGLVRGASSPLVRGFAGMTYKRMTDTFKTMDAERLAMRAASGAPTMTEAQKMIVVLREICPDPSVFNPDIHDAACPKYYELKDVAELVIKCPTNPSDFNPKIHDDACQKVYTLADEYSAEDVNTVYVLSTVELSLRCPETAGQYKAGVHDAACPKYYDLKEVVAIAGSCPANPADFNPDVHDVACHKVFVLRETYPEQNWVVVQKLSQTDKDRDGVPDLMDRCPTVAGQVDRKGCPAGRAFVRGDVLKTAQPIEFAYNNWDIKPEMIPVLVEVAEALVRNPNMRIRIDGYADSLGKGYANRWVSNARAEATKEYLMKIGVDSSKVEVAGRGAANPIASNKTRQGRAKNRRVVFVVINK